MLPSIGFSYDRLGWKQDTWPQNVAREAWKHVYFGKLFACFLTVTYTVKEEHNRNGYQEQKYALW